MKRILLRLLIALVVIGAIVSGVLFYQSATREPPFTFRTAQAERSNIVARVTATGTVSANVTVQVGSQVSGRIQQINVDFNSPVKKGDVIAKIDSQLFTAAVTQARANELAAQGNLAKARAQALDADRQYVRSKALNAEGLVSQTDLDTAQTTAAVARASIDAARGAVEQARAGLSQAQINLAYCTIISPIDGVVISRNVDVGQTVAASLTAPTLFTIAQDLKQMQVDTNIAESDVGKLKTGMETTFVVDAYPADKFKGKIRQVRNAPQSVQNVVTYDAVIDVDNAELKLKPGMTANVTIVFAEKDGVIAVPNAALRFRPPPTLVPSGAASGAAPSAGASAGPRKGRGTHGGPRSSAAPVESAAAAPAGSVMAAGTASAALVPTVSPTPPAPPADSAPESEKAPDRRTLWLLRNGQPTMIRVRIGLSNGTITEIVRGDVNEGDEVIVEATSNGDPAPSAKAAAGAAPPRLRL